MTTMIPYDGILELFFLLLIGHALADFAFQPPNIALGKNRNAGPPPGYDESVHGPRQPVWIMVMTAHTLIHGGFVLFFTGSYIFGLYQVLTHWIIDYLKCEKAFNVWVDQALHVVILLMTAAIWGSLS